MLSIGFVLLTHQNQEQMLRLIQSLNVVFDRPRISCHHDFSKLSIDRARFPGNVYFVEDFRRTTWGGISLVEATLDALRLLYKENAPDWFYLLSGSDYPIKKADSIRDDLSQTRCDAIMTQVCIDHTRIPPRTKEKRAGFSHPWYKYLGYQRYIGRSYPVPSLRHPHRGPAATHVQVLNPVLLKPFHPFDEHFKCYCGDQWFAASAVAAEYILSNDLQPLLKYFKRRFTPDEAFFHTVLGNAPSLRICTELRHFIRWDEGNHPRVLDLEDLPDLMTSKAHFARKFAAGAPVLDSLDSYLSVRMLEKNHKDL